MSFHSNIDDKSDFDHVEIARRAFTALSRKTLIKRSGVGWGNVMRGQMHYSDKDEIYK